MNARVTLQFRLLDDNYVVNYMLIMARSLF
jgi:hypothetical protein